MCNRLHLPAFCTALSTLFYGSLTALWCSGVAQAGLPLSIHPAQRAEAVSAISISAPEVVNAAEGEFLSVVATAGSGDPRSIITISLTGAPPSLDFNTNTPTAIYPSATLSGAIGFQTAGTWLLRWQASDQFGAFDTTTTRLTIADTPTDLTFEARAFTSGGNKAIRLSSEKPTWCVQIEPLNGNFDLGDVDLSSIALSDARVYGSVISVTDETTVGGDRDRNGIQELTVCFSKENLRDLFFNDRGTVDVPVVVEGILRSGRVFRALMSVRVVGSRYGLRAIVSPNPVNPQAALLIDLPEAGFARVRLFDTSGRLICTLLDKNWLPAGPHTLPIKGRDALGRALGSGVYLYRVETVSGSATGRFAIVK